jgi:multiple sugar transport system ATP-binding protein
VQMRTEVARIQQRLGTTTVYVTHDQTEAMTLGDRVAVMRAGVLQQVGRPTELYNHPTNLFVAGFIGSPAMNFVPGTLSGSQLRTPFGELPVPEGLKGTGGGDREVIVGIRPEHLEDARVVEGEAKSRGATFKAKLDLVEALGAEYYAYFHLEGTKVESEHLSEVAADAGLGEVPSAKAGETSLVARLNEMSEIREGDEIELWLDTRRLQLFDPDSGENLAGPPSGNGAAASAAKAAEKPVAGQAG